MDLFGCLLSGARPAFADARSRVSLLRYFTIPAMTATGIEMFPITMRSAIPVENAARSLFQRGWLSPRV